MSWEHTVEPWHIGSGCRIIGGDSNRVAVCVQNDFISIIANSRRIVAAVNACKCISTEALESGVVQDLVTSLECMLEVFAESGDFEDFASVSSARAALAKVKGVVRARHAAAEELMKTRAVLEGLLFVINRDKDGSFFICEEAAHVIEYARNMLREGSDAG